MPTLRFVVLVLLTVLGLLARAEPPETGTAVIRGVVTSEQGPIAGAEVRVWHAFPRSGPAYTCPSCYLDCGKSATTSHDGSWEIAGLDDSLVFDVVVASAEHAPIMSKRIDPSKGDSLKIRLVARATDSLEPQRMVRGVVMGPDGDPWPRARIVLEGVYPKGIDAWSSPPDGSDEMALTDERGSFSLALSAPADTVSVIVDAPGTATTCVRLPAGTTPSIVRLTEGATVTGRMLLDGLPLHDVLVGLCSEDRMAGSCMTTRTVATRDDGSFTFEYIPAKGTHFVHPILSTEDNRTFAVRRISIDTDGQTVDTGDYPLSEGVVLAGTVVVKGGGTLPPDARIFIAHMEGWTYTHAPVGKSGDFEFRNLPGGPYTITVAADGMMIVHVGPGFTDAFMESTWKGVISEPRTTITVTMVPEK